MGGEANGVCLETVLLFFGLFASGTLVNAQNISQVTYKCLRGVYKGGNPTYDFVISSACANIPQTPDCPTDMKIEVESSSCFYYYKSENCAGPSVKAERSYSFRQTGRSPLVLLSVRRCETDSDNPLPVIDARVKLYRHSNYHNTIEDYLITSPADCRTLPLYSQDRTSSAKLPYCVILYENEDCTGSYKRLGKGNHDDFFHSFNDQTRSYKPCNPKDVLKELELQAKAVNFRIFDNPLEIKQKTKQKKGEMAATTTFINDGGATLTQRYEVEKSFTESIEITRSETISQMHKVSVSATASLEVSSGVPGIASGKATASLTAGYEFNKNSAHSAGTKHTTTKTEKFVISQNIEVPPCTSYRVSSFVLSSENYPLHYFAGFEIIGRVKNGPRIKAQILKHVLGKDLKYIKDLDNYTILAETENIIKMDYAWESVFSGEGALIQGCKDKSKTCKPSIEPKFGRKFADKVSPVGKTVKYFAENGKEVHGKK